MPTKTPSIPPAHLLPSQDAQGEAPLINNHGEQSMTNPAVLLFG